MVQFAAAESQSLPDSCQLHHDTRHSAERPRCETLTDIQLHRCTFAFVFIEENVSPALQRSSPPKFLIKGHLDATNCVISQPLTGELVVDNSDVPIKSIELQLVRVETCGEREMIVQACFFFFFFLAAAFLKMHACVLLQVAPKAMPETPRKSRTSRSPRVTSATVSPFPFTWCSPGSSPAPRWRPPTSKSVSSYSVCPYADVLMAISVL